MSEFGDGTFTQNILDLVKCGIVDARDSGERFRVIKAFHKIADYWLEDIEYPPTEK